MRTLICGSMAYDTIMVFHDHFKNHILPDQIHILNVAFLVPDMRREFGGCAGNIAYTMKLLGADPVIMATVATTSPPTGSGSTSSAWTRATSGRCPRPSRPRPSSPPTWPTTRSPPSTRAP